MMAQAQVKCEKCKGFGNVFEEEDLCKKCDGKKVIEQDKTLEVPVEQGCPDFHDYVLTG